MLTVWDHLKVIHKMHDIMCIVRILVPSSYCTERQSALLFFFLSNEKVTWRTLTKISCPPYPYLYNFSENVSKAKDFVTSSIINIPYRTYSKTFWNHEASENALWQPSFSVVQKTHDASYNQQQLTVNKTKATWWRRHPSPVTPPSHPWKELTNPLQPHLETPADLKGGSSSIGLGVLTTSEWKETNLPSMDQREQLSISQTRPPRSEAKQVFLLSQKLLTQVLTSGRGSYLREGRREQN